MKKYEVVATTGSYTKDGEKKYLNKNVGSVIETKHGFLRLKMDGSFNLAGCPQDDDGGVWLALFEPREKSQSGNERTQQSPPMPDDSDVPF